MFDKETTRGPRIVFDNLAELQAARHIVAAFAQFVTTSMPKVADETVPDIDRTVEAMDTSTHLHDAVTARTGNSLDTRNQFGEPYLSLIKMAVQVYTTSPGLLEPYLGEANSVGARIFFPPVQP